MREIGSVLSLQGPTPLSHMLASVGHRITPFLFSSSVNDKLGPKSHPALRLTGYFHFLLVVPLLVKIIPVPT